VAASADYPGLGRLLFFDPTDEHTPVGLMPQEEEGSQALLVSRDRGALLRMPSSPPEANRVERRLDLALSADGSLSGNVEEHARGHAAASYRRERERVSNAAYGRHFEAWISRSGSGAKMTSFTVAEDGDAGMRVALGFSAPSFAKSMRGNLLMFKPSVLPSRSPVHLPESTRKHPVVLNAQSFEEITRMKLPDSFTVDELPRPIRVGTSFGDYSLACEAKDGSLSCRRSFTVSGGVIPAAQYDETRNFFAWVNSSGGEPVVLTRGSASRPVVR
jgi:hypothetical protein